MIRTILLFSLGLPAIAAAAPCANANLAPLPATVPAPEMAIAAPATACTHLDAATFAARSRQPAPAGPAPAQPAAPAGAAPAAAAPATAAAGTGGYVPKTANDNTPWRFDMNQNGRRMTAEEFDAWMKAKGIRVATGKPAEAPPPTAQPASNATTGN